MVKIGIICEYNPLHNGHLYHIKKIKDLFPDSMIILVLSGNFVQRGEVSIIDKWNKTKCALNHNIDLVVELPFFYSTQSTDYFCYGSINILEHLKVDYLIFGSESNDINNLIECAKYSLTDKYQEDINKYISTGISYPLACAKALKVNYGPNDTLGIGYIKELFKLKSKITPLTIKRTNDYHSNELTNLSSASSIRNSLKNNIDISNSVPEDVLNILKHKTYFMDDYFNLLKYKIISSKDLSIFQGVDEGIENRILKYIKVATNYDELINLIKSKRYTYHRISRMLLYILCDFTKEERNSMNDLEYIRILGFNTLGQSYLNSIKHDLELPLLTKFDNKFPMLRLEQRVTNIYNFEDEYKKQIIIKR